MAENQSKKRVVVESTLHKELKLIAVENDMDLQDLVAQALELFITKCKSTPNTGDLNAT